MGALRFFGILIMCVCAFLVIEYWGPTHGDWYIRTKSEIGFFIGLLMLVEGIVGEIKKASHSSQAASSAAPKK